MEFECKAIDDSPTEQTACLSRLTLGQCAIFGGRIKRKARSDRAQINKPLLLYTSLHMLALKPIAYTSRPLAARALVSTLSRRTLSTQAPQLEIPRDVLEEVRAEHPRPMRIEFMGKEKLSSEVLEKIDIELGKHRIPQTFSDKFAYRLVKALRTLPDTYFGQDHYMRAVMLETIAAGNVCLKPDSISRITHSQIAQFSSRNGWRHAPSHEVSTQSLW